MDSSHPSAASRRPPPRKADEARPRRSRADRRPDRLAVAGGLLAWVLVDRSDDDDAAQGTTATTTSPLPSTPTEQSPAGESGRSRSSARRRRPARPRSTGRRAADTRLEVLETSSGLSSSATSRPARERRSRAHLTVATYARRTGTRRSRRPPRTRAAEASTSTTWGLAVYDMKAPTNCISPSRARPTRSRSSLPTATWRCDSWRTGRSNPSRRRSAGVFSGAVRRRRPRAGVDAERAEETADVVPDRLGARWSSPRSACRAALLKEAEHLDLAGVRARAAQGGLGCLLKSPKTPTSSHR